MCAYWLGCCLGCQKALASCKCTVRACAEICTDSAFKNQCMQPEVMLYGMLSGMLYGFLFKCQEFGEWLQCAQPKLRWTHPRREPATRWAQYMNPHVHECKLILVLRQMPILNYKKLHSVAPTPAQHLGRCRAMHTMGRLKGRVQMAAPRPCCRELAFAFGLVGMHYLASQ